MTVLSGALLNNVANITLNNNATVMNVAKGGQLGVGPRLARIDAATPLVFAPVVPIITHLPTMFKSVSAMGSLVKALIEQHTKSITGIDFGYEMDEASAYTLADGQEVKVPTKNKRTAISPNITLPEFPGNISWNTIRQWMNMISSADTHFSSLASMTNVDDLDPFVFSYFTMDLLLISFDPTMIPKNIIDATFITTMWPKTSGMIGMKKEIGTSESPERSFDFNGILQHNSNVFSAAIAIAEVLQLHKANFQNATPIATAIEDSSKDLGIEAEMTEILSEFTAAT